MEFKIIYRKSNNAFQSAVSEGLTDIYPRLWRFAMMLCSDRRVAEDLLQNTCLRALEKSNLFKPNTRLDSWLFRIMQRTWLNEIRATAVRRGNGILSVDEIELPTSNNLDAETNIFLNEVLSFVDALPEAQRATVLLAYVEGFSYAETAEILSVPVGTVMSRLATARKTVMTKVKGEGAYDSAKSA